MFMFNHYINFHVSASNIAPAILIQHNIRFSSFKKRESGGIVEGKGSRSASSRNVETYSHAVCVHQMMVF